METPNPTTTPVVTSYPTEFVVGDGSTIKVADNPGLKAFFEQTIAHAQKVQKDQLHGRITKLETDLRIATTQLQDTMAIVQTQESEHNRNQEELRRQLESTHNNHQGTPMDKATLMQAVKEVFETTLPQYMRPLQERTISLEQQRITEFKTKLLNENAGLIIPEMIQGNTTEELAASVDRAKEAFNRIKSNLIPAEIPAQGSQPPVQPAASQTQPLNPLLVRQPVPIDDGIPDIKNMSAEDFSANRAAILNKLKAKVGQ